MRYATYLPRAGESPVGVNAPAHSHQQESLRIAAERPDLSSTFGLAAIFAAVKKYSRDDHRIMATWALDCAERVLALFEAARPNDDRPRAAIAAGRAWVRGGEFSMPVIRGVSLGAHAAAKATDDAAAAAAAHAAGQAVATAHVPQHAYGGAYYALKAIASANPSQAADVVQHERNWQAAQLPERLREEITSRLLVEKDTRGVRVIVRKGPGF